MAGCSGEFKGDRRYIITSGLTGEHSAAFRTLTAAARLVSRMSSEASDSELSDAEQGAISAEESLSCVPCPRYQNNRGAHLHRSTSSNSGSVLQSESVSAVKDSEVPSAVDAGFATAGAWQDAVAKSGLIVLGTMPFAHVQRTCPVGLHDRHQYYSCLLSVRIYV